MKKIFIKYAYSFLLAIIIIIGILLRLKGFLINPSFWNDESGLAWNIKFKSYSELFGILRFLQVAPPFFTISTKFLTNIFGFSEMVFRLIPCIGSCLSLIAFYFLAERVLNERFAILTALILFVVNTRLVFYSFEFKPYETDVLLTILCLLFFVNLNAEKLNIRKAFIYGFGLALLPWFSLVSVFIIAGGVLNLIFKNIKQNLKEKLFIILPIIVSGLIYLKLYLFANYTGTQMVSDWDKYFITKNPLFFFYLFTESLKYLFLPVTYRLFILILFIWGIIIYIKEKSTFLNVAVLSFIIFLFAAFLHLYPFGERLILFLIPIYLLFIIKPLDLLSFNNKIKSVLLIIIMLIIFYPQLAWANSFLFKTKYITKDENAREMMNFMIKNKKDSDIIFVNASSRPDYNYYASFYNIKNKVIQVPSEIATKDILNSIKKGNYCWLYMSFEPSKSALDWIKDEAQIIRIIKDKDLNSYYLIYVYIR